MSDISGERITRIERLGVHSPRPRDIGFNSRIGAHGTVVHDLVVRVHTASGAVGVGWSRLERAAAEFLVGRRFGELFHGCRTARSGGGRGDRPAAVGPGRPAGGECRCIGCWARAGSRAVELYDGSIYIDDLDAGDDGSAGDLSRRGAHRPPLRVRATSRSRSGAARAGCRPPPGWSATCW